MIPDLSGLIEDNYSGDVKAIKILMTSPFFRGFCSPLVFSDQLSDLLSHQCDCLEVSPFGLFTTHIPALINGILLVNPDRAQLDNSSSSGYLATRRSGNICI